MMGLQLMKLKGRMLMHKSEDFKIDIAELTPEALAERSWKRAALLEIISRDIFSGLDLSRLHLCWDSANPKLMVRFPGLTGYYETPVMVQHGRADTKRAAAEVSLRCKSFTKLNPQHIRTGVQFSENCLEALEDFVEFALENRIICKQLDLEEARLWEKWPSFEKIWIAAALARGSWEKSLGAR